MAFYRLPAGQWSTLLVKSLWNLGIVKLLVICTFLKIISCCHDVTAAQQDLCTAVLLTGSASYSVVMVASSCVGGVYHSIYRYTNMCLWFLDLMIKTNLTWSYKWGIWKQLHTISSQAVPCFYIIYMSLLWLEFHKCSPAVRLLSMRV